MCTACGSPLKKAVSSSDTKTSGRSAIVHPERYAAVALEAEADRVAHAVVGTRNDALNRQVCTNDNIRGAPQTCSAPVRVEGAPPFVGAAAADVNSAYDLSGVTYAFYLGLGRDSVQHGLVRLAWK